jgi:hypothetical protein
VFPQILCHATKIKKGNIKAWLDVRKEAATWSGNSTTDVRSELCDVRLKGPDAEAIHRKPGGKG